MEFIFPKDRWYLNGDLKDEYNFPVKEGRSCQAEEVPSKREMLRGLRC
jgi:hypothetical protein